MAGQCRVLVIDDDPDFNDFVQIVLSANGYQVDKATSAREGLDMMRQDPPDLVIVDLMMSYVLDGWNVSREMCADERLCRIPIVVVSAVVSDQDDLLFPDTGEARMDAFMSKPVGPSELLGCVSSLTEAA